VDRSEKATDARLQAHANRPPSRCERQPHRRPRHDLERSNHRPLGHALRRRHLPPRHALRRAVPQQTPRRQVHQPDVPSEC
ncbi:hypothetical protein LTR33_018628, partial [Friedmanniomyces endolithicus]